MKHDLNSLTKSDLTAQGFSGFTTIRELQENIPRSEELSQRGVYAVVCSHTYTPSFIGPDKVRKNHNVIMPWSLEKLEKKWVPGVDVLYFGKAGTDTKKRTLRKRLSELIRHSMGKTTKQGPHKGGELLWQLRGYMDFEVGFLPTDQPEKEEGRLIGLFLSNTGKLPFANRTPHPRYIDLLKSRVRVR
jgi:hypothetical protein